MCPSRSTSSRGGQRRRSRSRPSAQQRRGCTRRHAPACGALPPLAGARLSPPEQRTGRLKRGRRTVCARAASSVQPDGRCERRVTTSSRIALPPRCTGWDKKVVGMRLTARPWLSPPPHLGLHFAEQRGDLRSAWGQLGSPLHVPQSLLLVAKSEARLDETVAWERSAIVSGVRSALSLTSGIRDVGCAATAAGARAPAPDGASPSDSPHCERAPLCRGWQRAGNRPPARWGLRGHGVGLSVIISLSVVRVGCALCQEIHDNIRRRTWFCPLHARLRRLRDPYLHGAGRHVQQKSGESH